ncbi:CaiB/BaiF CoA transferase family protein [Natrarchaeobaculum sulfurireducens]|uniref:L-carnitine dehydratase/bile acid-inducible protein F n=1 Tax=Natrarchaeobaculum sulfurireducens TaxID=2044521 RepID=A0A346PCL7_9EURY|nr:CaiB/BaiF CoA-transferase family protein [Natrarchaeobaculum sulfurireducens]AXR77262.1 Succinyl-CoA:mesaconate CoA-transferase [Natrarchaeobaculum sulfurireducens]AXR82776.1 L-carnitine dehydratase/bile acid-inducible protein F [Natrarchaeobaculum sulfurireducens]
MVGEAREPDGESGPLEGITVLDASQVLVGPFCTMQLADMGADVIKVERPDVGDQTRGWYPPQFGEGEDAVSAYYASVNRNKRSVSLNLKTEDGRELLRELAADADVFVENFRVGTLEEWGLGYEDLTAENPDLVYCSLSGYGEWGPYADRPAYDLIMQAEGGFMSITGEEGGAPVRIGVAIADIGAGMYAAQAILGALFHRERGGSGQKIDISLFDGQVAWLSYMASNYFATGEPPKRMGSRHPTITPYQAFPTSDGYVVIAAASEKLWRNLCHTLDREDLLEEERFETNADRVDHRDALEEILEAEFADWTTDDLVETLEAGDVPARAVHDIGDVFDHPQVDARNMHREIPHPDVGSLEMVASPMHFSGTPTSIRRHPPSLGEHTDEVLAELGYDESERERLRDANTV